MIFLPPDKQHSSSLHVHHSTRKNIKSAKYIFLTNEKNPPPPVQDLFFPTIGLVRMCVIRSKVYSRCFGWNFAIWIWISWSSYFCGSESRKPKCRRIEWIRILNTALVEKTDFHVPCRQIERLWQECVTVWEQGWILLQGSLHSGGLIPQATGGYRTAAPQLQWSSSKLTRGQVLQFPRWHRSSHLKIYVDYCKNTI